MIKSSTLLQQIRIVLVNTTHPGNIGAAARAMKTMGLQHLYLVNPERYPNAQASERATHAFDILENACVVDSLATAIHDCHFVYATSARPRFITWPTENVHEAALRAVTEASHSNIAFVFGREQSGLTNEELELCHHQVQIPANPDYSSLNLAAAVQIICYELRMAWLANVPPPEIDTEIEWSTMEEMEGFYQHLEQVLLAIHFLKPGLSGQVIPRLRRLFVRSRIEKIEMNILRGILTSIEKSLTP